MVWIERFGVRTRLVHWSLAALVATLVATGAILYVDEWAAAVGRRHLVRDVHLLSGLAVPLLVVGAAVAPGSRRYRNDLRLLDTWPRREPRPRPNRRRPVTAAKFGTLQRAFAAWAAGALAVLVLTGAVLHWFRFFPLEWRTRATAIHDLAAFGLAGAAGAHVVVALAHPAAMRGMVTGWVRGAWARRAHPGWYELVMGAHAASQATPSTAPRAPAEAATPAGGPGHGAG